MTPTPAVRTVNRVAGGQLVRRRIGLATFDYAGFPEVGQKT